MSFNIFNLFKKRSIEPQPIAAASPPDPNVVMAMKNIVALIEKKHKQEGIQIHPPATLVDIARFEQQIGFALPEDFKAFYTICNGFGCTEDIFNMTPLEEITKCDKGDALQGFYFAEYMTNCDMWGLRFIAEGKYEIFNGSYPRVAMTSSLEEFLNHFLEGDVFEKGGLYDWFKELKVRDS